MVRRADNGSGIEGEESVGWQGRRRSGGGVHVGHVVVVDKSGGAIVVAVAG